MTRKSNFYDFPPVTAKEWKQQIQFGLRGKDYNELLVWDSPDQIKVKPFYHSEDLKEKPVPAISAPGNWKIGQLLSFEELQSTREEALKALGKGAESLFFLDSFQEVDHRELLKGIDLERNEVHLQVGHLSPSAIDGLKALRTKGKTFLFVHFDPIGHLGRTGNWQRSMQEDLSAFTSLVREIPEYHPISVDGTLYQNAGANRVQQLAYMLAHVNEYLHLIVSEKAGNPIPVPVFRVALDSNYFFELAKLRALRLLWTTLSKEYGAPEQCHILAEPSRRNKTLYEYNANMLRTTMECMAAVNGGANTVFNLPYDALYHKHNDFGDRIARNQLLILREEAYLGTVSNPSDGAYYIESLTQQLAEKALEVFKYIEASGGFLSALKKHTIQKKIREQAVKEQEDFDRGELVLVGANSFKNPSDTMRDAIEISPFPKGKTGKTLIEPILEKRLSENLEKKRLEDE